MLRVICFRIAAQSINSPFHFPWSSGFDRARIASILNRWSWQVQIPSFRHPALALIGLFVCFAVGSQVYGQTCHTSSPVGGVVTDNVANYASSGGCPTSPPVGQPGTDGICLGSIQAAIACASSFYSTSGNAAYNYILTVGSAHTSPVTIDLTHDLSAASTSTWQPTANTFEIDNFVNAPAGTFNCSTPTQSGCFVVQGYGGSSANTTITTVSGELEILIKNSSHVLFQHLTLRENAETMTQGTYVTSAPTTLTEPAGTGTFWTVTADMLAPSVVTPLQNLRDSVAIATSGSGYAFGPVTITLPTPSTCSAGYVISAQVNSSGAIFQINSVLTPPSCTTYPTSPSAVTPTSCPVSGTCATFYVAYIPTPMSQWIAGYNVNYPASSGQITAFMKSYTNASAPVSVPSSAVDPATGDYIASIAQWGASRIGMTYYPQPPTLDATHPNRWTMTFQNTTNVEPFPPYFSSTSNIICMHADSQTAFQVKDLAGSSNGGSDIIFNDIVWVNVGRGVFQGVTGAQILGSSISRDPTTYSGGQLPCYSSESGGPQFSQLNDPAPTYGNQIISFSAVATADDSIAMYNDVGGSPNGSSTYPQSNIKTSTITSADGHPIRLSNNSSITMLNDVTNPHELDAGNCPYSPTGTGSPVCVDSTTTNVITSTTANCDTYRYDNSAGNGCPIYYDWAGFTQP
jgi:hypothetical protein